MSLALRRSFLPGLLFPWERGLPGSAAGVEGPGVRVQAWVCVRGGGGQGPPFRNEPSCLPFATGPG